MRCAILQFNKSSPMWTGLRFSRIESSEVKYALQYQDVLFLVSYCLVAPFLSGVYVSEIFGSAIAMMHRIMIYDFVKAFEKI